MNIHENNQLQRCFGNYNIWKNYCPLKSTYPRKSVENIRRYGTYVMIMVDPHVARVCDEVIERAKSGKH